MPPPERMLRNGRPVDPVFATEELLFRRYIKEHWDNNRIVDAHFSFPKPSVNREKYSEPQDVLYSDDGQYNDWGVLEFSVNQVPKQLSDGEGRIYVFFPSHVPEEENYSHSEIWCERNAAPGQEANPSSTVKKKFRALLSQQAKVRILSKV